jgi:AbrB family looped-hinge helix DNA binding protein
MASVTLSSKFQISIPKAVRAEMHLQAGQRFAIITKGDIISLVPIRPLEEMRGIFKGADTSDIRDRTDRLVKRINSTRSASNDRA